MKIRDTMTGKTIGIMMLLTALLCYGFRNSQPQAYETIHEAAEKGSLEDVKRHLKQGVDVNAKDKDGYTPLHRAAVSGFKDVAELLIANGADVNAKDKDGRTLLRIAIDLGHSDVAELLKKHGARE